jgi:hypothetical protein
MTLSLTMQCIMAFSMARFSISELSIMTLSFAMQSKMAFSIARFSISALSIMILSITINLMRHSP